jgi:hypothetical protein
MQEIEKFLKSLENVSDVETQLEKAIDFMQMCISLPGAPDFKNFWEAKKLCQTLFKKPLPQLLRSSLFQRYRDISKEGETLKTILDQESRFASEQIEMAISSIESDLAIKEELIQSIPPIEFPFESQILKEKKEVYDKKQKQIDLFNKIASKINGLRKELISQEIKMRQKNQFFHRLSLIGDQVFPIRKLLIKEMSEAFQEDVKNFIATYFKKEGIYASFFELRDEIKSLQAIAKIYSLNTETFNQVRQELSDCWDLIKKAEKEKRIEREQKLEQERLKAKEALLAVEVEKKEALLSKKKEEEKESLRLERYKAVKIQIDDLILKSSQIDAKTFKETYEALIEDSRHLILNKKEKQVLQSSFTGLKDLFVKKREQELLETSHTEVEKLVQLKKLLKERVERRREIKAEVDSLRGTQATLGSQFEQAFTNLELLNKEKNRLFEIDALIEEVKEEITSLEAHLKV